MSETTSDNADAMPPQRTEIAPVTTDLVSKMKLFAADHKLADKIFGEAQMVVRGMTMQQILREAVHLGLPIVARRYRSIVEAAIKAEKLAEKEAKLAADKEG